MGTSTMIDILGSILVGSILLIMALRLNAAANETTRSYNENFILQENLTTLVDILETDFKKIGYLNIVRAASDPLKKKDWKKLQDPTTAVIRIADSTKLQFYTDVGGEQVEVGGKKMELGDGKLDSITYYLGPVSELNWTPNPDDRYLYRQVNTDAPSRMNLGVTQFSIRYFDAENDLLPFPITKPQRAYFMEITIAVESAVPFELEYSNDKSQYEVFWKQMRLVTKNLRNR